MNDTVKEWTNKVIGGFIVGASHAGSAWLALAIGNAAGLNVPILNWKAFGSIMLINGIVKTLGILENMPLPGFKTNGNTAAPADK